MKVLRSLIETTTLNPQDILSKLKSSERSAHRLEDTKGFALEDDKGNLVRVRVPRDQASEFERALGNALDEKADDEIEIAQILFELKDKFDIVDVNWSEGSIPEDEETENTLQKPTDADVESPEGEFPGGDKDKGSELGDKEDKKENETDLMQPEKTDVSAAPQSGDAFSALQSVIDMLKSDADARKAEAEAKKAEAAVAAGKVAAEAAASRTRTEEEILDMENYNKQKKEEKRQRDLQAKLIRYRHDLEHGIGESTMNINENDNCQFPDATPEEEEVLDMEKWEDMERKRKEREKTHERLKKFRHAKKHGNVEQSNIAERKQAPTFKQFMQDTQQQNKAAEEFIDLSHRAQR